MKLPIRFPSDADVIAEEAGRFRALSNQDRLQVIRGLLDAGALMLQISPQSAFLVHHAVEQEKEAHRAVRDFIARHVN